MDELIRDIHETLERYKSCATYAYKQDGVICHVLVATEEAGFEMRTTWPRANFYQPPLDLEKTQGMTGIAGNYKMPEGLSHVELQAYGEVLRHAELAGDISADTMNDKFDQLLGALEARNPQLSTIRQTEDKLSRYNVILGIASEFNPKDIQFFIGAYPAFAAPDDPDYDATWSRIAHLQLAWIPAPETLKEIDRQLQAQPAPMPAPARCPQPINCP